MPIEPDAWYDPSPDASAFYQGDVVYNVPVVFMPPAGKQWVLLRPNKGNIEDVKRGSNLPTAFAPRAESQASNPWSDGTDLVLAKGTRETIAILTQTCDLVNRKYWQCAPVYLIPGARTPEEVVESYHQFPLPGDAELPSSYVELSMVTSVHASYLKGKNAKLVKRLSGAARAVLQAKLAKFYGRPFGFTVQDPIPQDSDYLCFGCFLGSAVVTRQSLSKGINFPPCSRCGERAVWSKFPSDASPGVIPTTVAQTLVQPPEAHLDLDAAEES